MRLVSCCFFLGATGNEVVSFVSFGYRRNKNSQKSFPLSLLQRVLFLEVHLNPAVESHHSIFLQKWQNRDPCLGGNKKEVILDNNNFLFLIISLPPEFLPVPGLLIR